MDRPIKSGLGQMTQNSLLADPHNCQAPQCPYQLPSCEMVYKWLLQILVRLVSKSDLFHNIIYANDGIWNFGWGFSVTTCASKSSIRRFVITTEKAPTRAFSWLKAATTAFTFKTLLRHYAKQALIPRSLNVKFGPWRNYYKGRAALRHYANQPAHPLWPLRRGPNFKLRDRGVNARLA